MARLNTRNQHGSHPQVAVHLVPFLLRPTESCWLAPCRVFRLFIPCCLFLLAALKTQFCYFIVPFQEIRVARVSHSSRKSSATHSYQCVEYFLVSKQWCSCHCFGSLTYSDTDVDARDCTRGLYGHRKRVCTES